MVPRWWVVLCVSVVWDNVSLQPTTNGQSECCPCPKDKSRAALDQDGAGSTMDMRVPVDCPCRARDADSAGASSMFFPNAVRAVRPFVTLDDSKENPNPILHPEVNLASSVLETLREATDEEYREALARDAARSAVDGEPAETARNLVTVIINPKDPMEDDVMAEASHVHEARCISPPIGRSSLSKSPYKPVLLTDILNLPKRKPASFRSWNSLDMDSGAAPSIVNERIVKPTFKSDFTQFKSAPSKSNLVTDSVTQSPLDKLISKLPDLRSNVDKDRSSFNRAQPTTPKFRTPKIEIPSIVKTIPKLNVPSLLRSEDDDMASLDNQGSASILNEQFTGFEKDNCKAEEKTRVESESMESSLKSFNSDLSQKPSGLRIFKMPDLSKDFLKGRSNPKPAPKVLPKSSIKLETPGILNSSPKVNGPNWLRKDNDDLVRSESQNVERTKVFDSTQMPNFKSSVDTLGFNADLNKTISQRRDAATDLLSNFLKGLEIPNLSNLFSSDVFNLRNNDDQVKSNDETNKYNAEILDTVPSPSEIKSDHVTFSEVECKNGINTNINNEKEDEQKILERNPIKTEIIDHVPESSNVNEISENDVNSISRDNNAEMNAAMAEINDNDMIDDTFSGATENNQFENVDFFKGVDADDRDYITDIDDIDVPRESDLDQPNNNNNERSLLENEDKNMSLRNKIRKTLDNLKNRSKINMNKSGDPTITDSDDVSTSGEHSQSRNQNKESAKKSTETLDCPNPEDKSSENQVNIDDLQQMSDSLLDQEKLREDSIAEQSKLDENNLDDAKNPKAESIEDENHDESIDENGPTFGDNSMLETKNMENVKAIESPNNINNENSCLEVGPNKNIVQARKEEMEAEASDRITDTIAVGDNLRESLRQSILEPISLKDINLPSLNVGDLFNLDNPLPGLFTSKSSTGSFSTRNGDTDNLRLKQVMSPSTNSYKSSLLPLQPLEDINLDILQLKPLSPNMQTLPRLNLNSFKSKLAIPDSLQLRPLLLESSIGNEKGVIGASMSFGKDKKGTGRSNNKMLQQASLKKPEILRSPLGILSNLDELRDTMFENTQNLFNTPLETTSRNVVEDTLRSGQVFSENLRVGAENAMKGFQQNLESTFGGIGLSDGLIPSPSHGNPSNLFEEISRRHEDVNDKLKGIHYDLTDRLETLRNNLFDDYKLPSFRSSILPTLGSPLGTTMARQGSTKKSKFRSSNSSKKGKKISSSSEPKGKFANGRTSTDKNKFRAAEAASTPISKTLKSPQLKQSESSILQALGKGRTDKLSLPRDRPSLRILPKTDKNIIDTDRPIFKKTSFPKLGKSNVKISFSTTELPPIIKNKPRLKQFTGSKSTSTKDILIKPLPRSKNLPSPKGVSRDQLGLINKLRDSSPFASETVPSRIRAPFKERQTLRGFPPVRVKTVSTTTESESEPPMGTTTSISWPKPPTLDKVYNSNSGQGSPDLSLKPKSPLIKDGTVDKVSSSPLRSSLAKAGPLAWPKTGDDTFLTKVREALKARLAGISPGLNTDPKLDEIRKISTSLVTTKSSNVLGSEDMARSASNNIDIVVNEPLMQENTSYSCKMMCTKNK